MVIRPSKIRLTKEEIDAHKNYNFQSKNSGNTGIFNKAKKVLAMSAIFGMIYIFGCKNF